jgi:hypothetical protein
VRDTDTRRGMAATSSSRYCLARMSRARAR